MPDVPVYDLPSGGAFGYAATDDPQADSETHELDAGGVFLNGDVTGQASDNVVTAIRGFSVEDTAPNDGDFLQWVTGSGEYQPVAGDPGGYAPATRYEAAGADPITDVQVPFDIGSEIHIEEGYISLVDSQPQERVALKDDGSGLALTDTGANPVAHLSEASVQTTKFLASEDAIWLYDINAVQRLLVDNFGSGLLQLVDDNGVLRLHVDNSGSGLLQLVDENSVQRFIVDNSSSSPLILRDGNNIDRFFVSYSGEGSVRIRDGNDIDRVLLGGDQSIQLIDSDGVQSALIDFDGSLHLNNPATSTYERAVLRGDGSGLVLKDGLDVIQQRIGDAAIGFFAATPVGQQAFIDPTTITPEQIGNILIAFGFMAPS